VSDPDIHGTRKITSVDGILWYNGEEHMGQIMQLPVAIKMKMDVLFVVFGKKYHDMHLCAILMIAERILAAGVRFLLVSSYIYMQYFKLY
jgi:hypothetical protein